MLTTILFSAILLDISSMEKVLATMTTLTLHGVTDTLSPEYEKYSSALQTAGEAFREAEALFNDPAFSERRGWKKDTSNDVGDVVYGKSTPRGKMVAVETELPSDVDFVMSETWKGVDGLPKWNKNINFASTVASPTEHFDIITYGNNDVLIVSGRDFISSRVYRKIEGGGYIMASKSIDLPGHPAKGGKVRAELILAGARFRPHPDKSDVTLVNVIMLADLKGMLPKFLVNQVLGKIMLMDTEANRKHFEDLNKERKNARVKRDEGAEKQTVDETQTVEAEDAGKQNVDESPEKQTSNETMTVEGKKDENAEKHTADEMQQQTVEDEGADKQKVDDSLEKQTKDETLTVGDESGGKQTAVESPETNTVEDSPEKQTTDEMQKLEDKKDESAEKQTTDEMQKQTVDDSLEKQTSDETLTGEDKRDESVEKQTVEENPGKQTSDETLTVEDKSDESADKQTVEQGDENEEKHMEADTKKDENADVKKVEDKTEKKGGEITEKQTVETAE